MFSFRRVDGDCLAPLSIIVTERLDMLETCYEDRTDGFEKKEQLLLKAHREGNLDLCLSLLSSMKDTVAHFLNWFCECTSYAHHHWVMP